MNIYDLYNTFLVARIAILLFLGTLTLTLSLPESKVHDNFIAAFRTFGVTMFIWAGFLIAIGACDLLNKGYIYILFISVSLYNINAKILARSFAILLNAKSAPPWRSIVVKWALLNAILIPSAILYNESIITRVLLCATATISVVDVLFVVYHIYRDYIYATASTEEFMEDNIEPFTKWMRNTSIAMLIWYSLGLGIGLMPIIALFIYSSIGTIISLLLTVSYFNYLLEIQPVNVLTALICDIKAQKEIARTQALSNLCSLDKPINDWVESNGFLEPMINIESLADQINSNRAYLSTYVNKRYNMNFRNWIASMRVEYAKGLMLKNRDLTITEIARVVNYTQSSFSTIFKKHCGEPIGEWRKRNKIG